MADFTQAQRHSVLSGLYGGSPLVRLTACEPASRISLRAASESVAALSTALGLALPTRPKGSAAANGRLAFWLGPDEWLVIDETGSDLMAACAGAGAVHSAADVSHRNVGIIVSGPGAADALNGGCSLDLSLSAFPVGSAARTLFGKVEIVLYRMAEDTFRVECWRSFAEYTFGLLSQAAEDAAA